MALAKALESGNCRLTSLETGCESRVAVPLHHWCWSVGGCVFVLLFVVLVWGWKGLLGGGSDSQKHACMHAEKHACMLRWPPREASGRPNC